MVRLAAGEYAGYLAALDAPFLRSYYGARNPWSGNTENPDIDARWFQTASDTLRPFGPAGAFLPKPEVSIARNPRTSGPRIFREHGGRPLPVEYEGFGPIAGDVLERDGTQTAYRLMDDQEIRARYSSERRPGTVMVAVHESGRTRSYMPLSWPHWGGDYWPSEDTSAFTYQGKTFGWAPEIVDFRIADGVFRWVTWICVPTKGRRLPKVREWTDPELESELGRRWRAEGALSLFAQRATTPRDYEYFDPRDVFQAAEWFCQLCGSEVDPSDATTGGRANLDHIIPVSRGGNHTRANTQLTHLRCNMRKGARMPDTAAASTTQPLPPGEHSSPVPTSQRADGPSDSAAGRPSDPAWIGPDEAEQRVCRQRHATVVPEPPTTPTCGGCGECEADADLEEARFQWTIDQMEREQCEVCSD